MSMDETPRLKPEQYWEWRTTIAEVEIEKSKLKECELQYKLLQRDAEILQVRTQLYVRVNIENQKAKVKSALEEYERYKKVLEETLGVSLSDKMIDDVTYEVKDLPKDPETPINQ